MCVNFPPGGLRHQPEQGPDETQCTVSIWALILTGDATASLHVYEGSIVGHAIGAVTIQGEHSMLLMYDGKYV